MDQHTSNGGASLAKGTVAGVVGGLVGAWVMTQFHVALFGRGTTGTREPQSHRPVDRPNEDATTKAADAIAVAATGDRLSHREKRWAGPAVHYAFAAAVGAMYGAVAEVKPGVRLGRGVAFGVAVWTAADELALPALDLAHGPTAYPPRVHAEMLAAHFVFGVSTDLVMGWTRRRIEGRPRGAESTRCRATA